MNVGLKAGAFPQERPIELEILDDLLVKHLSGNEQRNTGGVGRHEACRDPAFQIINRHAFCRARGDAGERSRRGHFRCVIA